MPARNEDARALKPEEHQLDPALVALRSPIDEGNESGFTDGNPFDRIRRSLNLPR
ncbi:MAG TPA: hypothetical protein VGM43_19165 [Bryobacteraceae bacterium]|jgi:hypothetical protein